MIRPGGGRPIGRLGSDRPQGVFGGLSYYQLVILFFNIVPLVMEFTMNDGVGDAVVDMGKLGTSHGPSLGPCRSASVG
jgi:hypothetical protein